MKTMRRRFSAFTVALVMMLSLFSVGALAWGTEDGISVYWNDKLVGTVTYDQMYDDVSQATKEVTYSSINSKGKYKTYTGHRYRFEQLLEAVNKDADWEAASDDTLVVFKDSEYDAQAELTKQTLTENRYYFDEDGFRVDRVDAGFLLEEGNDYFQFVYGQTSAEEKTNSNFTKFTGAGNSTVKIYTPVMEIIDPDGVSNNINYYDLKTIWQDEGSNTYTYSTINTKPTFKTEDYSGPTLAAVLAKARIDLDTLSDTDVVRFDSSDGQGLNVTVKDIKATRYCFPNGKSTNHFTGTTDAQRQGSVEVPYILSIDGGAASLRDVFGQQDPQEQQKSYFIKYLNKITVTRDAATEFTGLTPTIADGSKVNEGDKLNFDLSLPTGVHEGFIYYTVSTDGTEPADPTYSDILYNFAQNQTDDQDYLDPDKANLYNSYEFTDAETTIIKVVTYVSGYTEPTVMTLRYEKADASALELTSSEGTDLKAKKHTTLTVENGKEGDQYKFIVYNKTTQQWYKLRDFEESNTFDWYTGPAGEKVLYADVLDENDDITRIALDGVTVTDSDLAVKSFTISPEGVLPTKSHATLTAEAEKGATPYEYKFIVYNETTQQWYKLKDFGPESTFDWYTGPEGSKKLYVDVKDADGTVVRQELAVTVTEAGTAQLDNAA